MWYVVNKNLWWFDHDDQIRMEQIMTGQRIRMTFNNLFRKFCLKKLLLGLNLSQDVFQERRLLSREVSRNDTSQLTFLSIWHDKFRTRQQSPSSGGNRMLTFSCSYIWWLHLFMSKINDIMDSMICKKPLLKCWFHKYIQYDDNSHL